MPRPTKEQMVKTLVRNVPDGGISFSSLRAAFPTWKDATFESLLELAIEQERVSRAAGGGGGVIRPCVGQDVDEDELERLFLAAIKQVFAGDYGTPVKSADLCEHLGWDDVQFKRIRKKLQQQGTISVSRGPYANMYLTSSADTDSSNDEAASVSGTPGSTAEVPKQSLLPIEEIDAYKDGLMYEIDGLSRHGKSLRNQNAMASFSYSRYAFWQCMTQLADDGKIRFHPGESSAITLCQDKSDDFVNGNDFHIQFGEKIKDQVKVLLRLLSISCGRESVHIEELAGQCGMSVDKAICACTRLLRNRFIIPLMGGLVKLDDTLSTEEPEVGADKQKLAVLREFRSKPALALGTLMDRLGGESQGRKYIESCDALLSVDEDAGLVSLTVEALELLESNIDSNAQIKVICDSPTELAELESKLAQGHVMAFVGAGISSGAGLPGWGELLKHLIENSAGLGKEQLGEIKALIDRSDYVGAASAIEHVIGSKFADGVVKMLRLNGHKRSTDMAGLVALATLRPHFNGFLTTNVDKLLELALECECSTELSAATLQQGRKDVIFHLHGHVDDPNSWVFTHRQYSKKWFSEPYQSALKAAFAGGRTLAFMGYGMRDHELDYILSYVEGTHGQYQQATHYFFIESDEARSSPYLVSRLERLGIRAIRYRGHENFPLVLAQLALSLEKRRG